MATAPAGGIGVAVVVPCYRVTRHVLEVLARIGPEVDRIYCVDDACPDGSGDHVEAGTRDPRVRVLRHASNQGVGGATLTGYRQAIADGARVIVKLDGDGQMDPALLPAFVAPILAGEADYAKGNRFWDLGQVHAMPLARRVGNLGLSFLAKASTGYWDIFDPTNGYTAVHAGLAARLPLERISRRYFFESDLLFHLNLHRACVVDVPMAASYGSETSHLNAGRALLEFPLRHARNALRRIFYNYFFRDMSVGSIELLAALGLLGFGAVFGGLHWWDSARSGVATPVGTIMIATVAVISGLQFLLAFVSYDVSSVPRRAVHRALARTGGRDFGPETFRD
ncbi:glycosyltransferase family 2 protein [Arenimonas sp.]|uniref:glycosyltransferase family 2 protein n=1 Tax=Arenimonas sp. TaxID=1872635 RepID=UPI0035B121CA